jgi:diguanylate cyclase (GGDEF)-like protein
LARLARPRALINSSRAILHKRFFHSTAIPAVLAGLLFAVSGGDFVFMGIAFALLIWSFFSTRYRTRHPIIVHDERTTVDASDFKRAGLEWCKTMSGARRVLLWRVDDRNGLVRVIGAVGGAAPGPHLLHGSPITWLARERISSRLQPPPEWAETERVIGVPITEETARHALTFELADDVEVNPTQFDGLGIYMGALINVMHDHEVLAAYQTHSQYLIDALRALPEALNVNALGRALGDAAIRLANANGAALSAWDGDHGTVLYMEGGGPSMGAKFSGSDSLTAMAARNATTIARSRVALRSVYVFASGERFPITPASVVAIALGSHGRVVGALTVWSAQEISQAAISDLETIAPYAASQLEHARQLGRMRELAERDALTGLYNRRAFDQHLDGEIARFDRYRRPFAVVMFDIDHFKKVNDTHGHDAGDEVLRKVGQIIASSLRDVDTAARYGGEEFTTLLPETDKLQAVELAERIRRRVETAELTWQGVTIPLTISAGVAAIPERGVAPADVVNAADQLLYEAKRSGRNRVCHK